MTSSEPRADLIRSLRSAAPVVLPSLLQCDYGHLEREVRALEEAGARALHLDVMDGHFVPNLSYGIPLVEAFRRLTTLPLDVHLMISNPGDYLQRYRDAGSDALTIHAEAVDDPRPLLDELRKMGCVAGLAINPPTNLEQVDPALRHCDLLLVMSVMPGFGGQSLEASALEKLAALKANARFDGLLSVDGGVNLRTIGACHRAGADLLVVGSGLFASSDYTSRLQELTAAAVSAHSPPHSHM